MRAAGRSICAIARALQRAKSTVSRELRRNGLSSGRYSPLHAAGAYQLRRRREAILEKDQKLRTFVCDRLAEGWTPEQISGWLKAGNERRLRAVGCETIYAFIYRAYQKAEQLWRYLTRRHRRRRPRRSRPSRDTIKDRVSIHERPKTIDARTEAGHWEGDLIICKRTRPVLVLHERKSRVTLAARLIGKTAAETISVMLAVFDRIAPTLRKSITFDNDTAFAQHGLLRTMRAMTTWFCDAYASWQKGGVENANGRLRRWLPRHTDIDKVSDEEIQDIVLTTNLKPRKCLGFKTPVQAILKELAKTCKSASHRPVAPRSRIHATPYKRESSTMRVDTKFLAKKAEMAADTINIAICFDENLVHAAIVLVSSIRKNAKSNRSVNIYAVTTVKKIDLALFLEPKAATNVKLIFKYVDNVFKYFPCRDYISNATYLRFLIPDILLDVNKIIYLDVDTIVDRDLAELFDVDLEGCPVAAMPDYWLLVGSLYWPDYCIPYEGSLYRFNDYIRTVLNICIYKNDEYFNCGVLLIDLAYWRRHDVAKTTLAYLSTHPNLYFMDQDALCHCIAGSFVRLDQRWNAFAEASFPDARSLFAKLRGVMRPWHAIRAVWRKDPWIVHYAGANKPWDPMKESTAHDGIWWRYAKELPVWERLTSIYRDKKARALLDAAKPPRIC